MLVIQWQVVYWINSSLRKTLARIARTVRKSVGIVDSGRECLHCLHHFLIFFACPSSLRNHKVLCYPAWFKFSIDNLQACRLSLYVYFLHASGYLSMYLCTPIKGAEARGIPKSTNNPRLTILMLDNLPPKAGVVDLLPSRNTAEPWNASTSINKHQQASTSTRVKL